MKFIEFFFNGIVTLFKNTFEFFTQYIEIFLFTQVRLLILNLLVYMHNIFSIESNFFDNIIDASELNVYSSSYLMLFMLTK